MRSASAAAFVLLIASFPGLAQTPTPDGEAVYRQHCASCHEGSLPRMPSRAELRSISPEQIEVELSSFSMRRQGAALSSAERRAVAAFLTGTPPNSYRAPLDVIPRSAFCSAAVSSSGNLSGAGWNGWGAGPQNARYQSADAAGLTAATVPRLKLKWAFGFPGVSAAGSQVTVMGNRVFVGSRNGLIYALDRGTGCLVWTFEADAGVRSTPVVLRSTDGRSGTLHFGDAYAQVYALDALTGTQRWKVKVETHPDAMITGGVSFHENRLYVPVSSLEEGTAVIPSYECCTFRGSVVALDAVSGRQIWKTYTINETPKATARNRAGTQLLAPSGAAVWSAPTLDPDNNRIYVATGDSYSIPAAPQSDAILALAMDTGRILWTRQTLPGDAWNTACLETTDAGRTGCPESAGPDHDFGSSAILATLAGGRRVLLAGQKSGDVYGVDPATGRVLWQTKAGDGGVLGGVEWGMASEGATVYASLSSAFEKKPGEAGGLIAINAADGSKKWTAAPAQDTCNGRAGCNTSQPAAVTVIPGVVFSGSLDGHMRAYETTTGKVIWDVETAKAFETVNSVPAKGGSINGPGATIVGGTLFVSSGYSPIGFMPGNVLLSFSVDGQ